jgi:hypothetical protein
LIFAKADCQRIKFVIALKYPEKWRATAVDVSFDNQLAWAASFAGPIAY